MSGVYAYCVLRDGSPPPAEIAGLGGAFVRAHAFDGLAIWVSDATARPKPELEAIRRHHEVVASALPHTVVPLRFGAWAASLPLLEARMREMRATLSEALSLVEGRVELGVRIQSTLKEGTQPPRADASSDRGVPTGSAYLRALSRRSHARSAWRRRQEAEVRGVREALGGIVHGERVRYLAPPELVSLAHLVRSQDEAEYRARVQSLAAEGGERRVHVTGPWPPYSFAAS